MKRTLTLIFTWLSFFSLNAQSVLSVSGIVTNNLNGSPIPNHEVIIMSDSIPGTAGYFHDVVMTGNSGFYVDTIVLANSQAYGNVIIKTMDCQNYYNTYTASFNPQNMNIVHDFSICWNNSSSCHAAFYANPDSTSNRTFHFTDQSTGNNITTWAWNFGDGTSTTITFPGNPNVTHTYTGSANVYTACLTIFSPDSCTDTQCETLSIGNTGCVANFTYSDSTNVPLVPVQFIDLSQSGGSTILYWLWQFGDPASGANNVSTLQNPVHSFSTNGAYNVCLTIRNADSSCFDMICKTITIGNSGGCQAYFTYRVDSIAVPAGTPVYFTDLSAGNPTGWAWSFGDGIGSSDQNPVHYYTGNGTYNVCLTITGYNCQDSYCTSVQIGTQPGCTSYFTYSTLYLEASFHGFINNTYGGGVFYWNFGDGNTGLGQSITHTYSGPGTYTVLMTAADSSGCSSTYTQNITVYDSLQTHQVYGQVFAGNFPALAGMVMIFSLDTTASYLPYVGVSTIDSSGIYYFTMVPDGDYYIYAIPVLPTGFLPTYYGDALNWENATLVQLGQPANPYDIHLLPAANAITGNGTINGQIGLGQIKTSLLEKVTMLLMDHNMNPINFYQVGTNGDFTFPSLSLGTYWVKAEIAGVTSDLVRVDLTEANPTANIVMTFTGNKILGLGITAPDLDAGTLYPNPASGFAWLSLGAKKDLSIRIDLFSLTGQDLIHFERTIPSGNTLLSIPVADLPKGIYTLQVSSPEGIRIIRKLVK